MRMTTGGTGLGLYIARQLTTAMGGTLRCTSVLGSGSTFRFELHRSGARTTPVVASPGAVPVPLPRPTSHVDHQGSAELPLHAR